MRLSLNRFRYLSLIALPLAAGCASPSWPTPPVPAKLTDAQAALLANDYLDQRPTPVALPRTLVAEDKQPNGWWLRYNGPFMPTATPPQTSYLVEVKNDGTVRQID